MSVEKSRVCQGMRGMKLMDGMDMGGNTHGGSMGMNGVRTVMFSDLLLTRTTRTRELCTACHRCGSVGGSSMGKDGVRMSAILMMLVIVIGIMMMATSTGRASTNEVPGVRVPSQKLHSRCSHASSRNTAYRTKTMATQAITVMSFVPHLRC